MLFVFVKVNILVPVFYFAPLVAPGMRGGEGRGLFLMLLDLSIRFSGFEITPQESKQREQSES